MRRIFHRVLCAALTFAVVSSTRTAANAQPGGPQLDARRSLAVTDLPILSRFSFQRVMDQLASLSGSPGLTGIQLFRQWWDTQNPQSPQSLGGPHCDDETTSGAPSINGYPYVCRPAPHEGRQIACQSFEDADCKYSPIGLFNRFDLAPPNGAHCGEYRIVYANQTGIASGLDRNLVIFEATFPNPSPALGLTGCLPIAQFWASLSSLPNIAVRADRLEKFYFDGLNGNLPAVVRPEHYGAGSSGVGQIRSNQFMGFATVNPKVWSLREFKVKRECPTCTLEFVPQPDAVNPFGPLFAAGSTLSTKAAFDAAFPTQVASLAANSIGGIGMAVEQQFNTAQSQASGSDEMNYLLHFTGPSTLRNAIDAQLASLGSSLTAENIVARAQAMSCAGCHQLNNGTNGEGLAIGGGLIWPPSLGFTHVTERTKEVVGGVERFVISPALISSFLPHRLSILTSFTRGDPLPPVPPGLPIGGRLSH